MRSLGVIAGLVGEIVGGARERVDRRDVRAQRRRHRRDATGKFS